MIKKIAGQINNSLRPYSFHSSARDGWRILLNKFKTKNPSGEILLPAYIGWSSNEGSGIFDPVRNSGLKYSFYKIKSDFSIDIQDFLSKVNDNTLVLLVHYFGFPDINYKLVSDWLVDNKVQFIEDCAHSILSDHIGGICGRKGLYSFYSLHKIFPIQGGGMIRANAMNPPIEDEKDEYKKIWSYDFYDIFQKRRENYDFLVSYLINMSNVKVIHPTLIEGVGPQTLPILVSGDRNNIYHEMNSAGFGMVSLYHTMINEISEEEFPDSHFLAQHMINFPVHQDINKEDLINLLDVFSKIYNS